MKLYSKCCSFCGENFETKVKLQIYCSKRCNYLAYYHRDPQKRMRANKKIRAKREDYYKELAKENYENRRDNFPARYLLAAAKGRAKKRGLEFTIEESDIVIPEICPALGVELKQHTPYAASLDRIDNSKGYVKGNVQVVSKMANSMKSNATPEELLLFSEWIDKTYGYLKL